MTAIAKIFAYLGAVALLGGLFAPVLHSAGTGLGRAYADTFLGALANMPLSRYFNRALLVAAVALVVPFLRWLGVRRFADLGFEKNPRRFRDLGVGILLAGGGLGIVAMVKLGFGFSAVRDPFPWHNVVGAVFTAIAVALIEETFFRGVLFGALRRELRPASSVAFLSVFFAVLHFMKPTSSDGPVYWWSGLALLPKAFAQFSDPVLVLVGWLTLVCVGVVLALAVLWTRSLFLSIGLHIGWVFALRAFSGATVRQAEPSVWFGRDLTTGVVPVVLVIATGVAVYLVFRRGAAGRAVAVGTALLLLLSLGCTQAPATMPVTQEHRASVEAWRAKRVERLTSAEGWLTLVGLVWLEPGDNTVGSAEDAKVRLPPSAPASLGVLSLVDGTVTARLRADAGVTYEGQPVGDLVLVHDTKGPPTTLRIGSIHFFVIERGGKLAVRIKDSAAPTRTGFVGLDYFPIDAAAKVRMRFVPYVPVKRMPMPTVLGTSEEVLVPGAVVGELSGQNVRIDAVLEAPEDDELFLVFADATTGKETYGAGRFLYVPRPACLGNDGGGCPAEPAAEIEVDFNLAYNPPCVFTPFATCPLPPPHSRLAVPVRAGELAYRAGH